MSAYAGNDSAELSAVFTSWDTSQCNWDLREQDDPSVNYRTTSESFQPFQLDATSSYAAFHPLTQGNTLAHDSSRFELLDDSTTGALPPPSSYPPATNAPSVNLDFAVVSSNVRNTATTISRPPRTILPSSNLPDPPNVLTPHKPKWYSLL